MSSVSETCFQIFFSTNIFMTQLSVNRVNIKKVRRHSSALESTICLQTSNLISIFDFCKNAIINLCLLKSCKNFALGSLTLLFESFVIMRKKQRKEFNLKITINDYCLKQTMRKMKTLRNECKILSNYICLMFSSCANCSYKLQKICQFRKPSLIVNLF